MPFPVYQMVMDLYQYSMILIPFFSHSLNTRVRQPPVQKIIGKMGIICNKTIGREQSDIATQMYLKGCIVTAKALSDRRKEVV